MKAHRRPARIGLLETEVGVPRIALDLNQEEDRMKVDGVWRRALGYDPSLPELGVYLETPSSSARQPDYDDSA
jgi:hypothetical protein